VKTLPRAPGLHWTCRAGTPA